MTFIATPNGPQHRDSSPEQLARLLAEYQAALEALGAPVEELMGEGIDRLEIEAKLESRGLHCPDELAVWFGWHNGLRDLPSPNRRSGIPLFYPSTLDSALRNYDKNRAELEVAYERNWDYEAATYGAVEGWLALDGLAETIAVECSVSGAQPPRVRWANEDFSFPDYSDRFRAVSLCTVIASWIESAQAGAFQWDSDRQLWEVDTLMLITDKTHSILG